MKEQFDKRLVEKIRNSFQDDEEAFDPREWEKFSHAYFNNPKKGRRIAYWPFWVSGIAASLLLLFFFLPFQKEIDEGMTALREEPAIVQGLAPRNIDEVPTEMDDESVLDIESKQPSLSSTKPSSSESKLSESVSSNADRTIYQEVQNVSKNNRDNIISSDLFSDKFDFPKNGLTPGYAVSDANAMLAITSTAPSDEMEEEKAQAWVEQWKNGEEEEKSNAETIIKQDKDQNLFRLGVIGGPQSASNQISGMQFGGGIISEFSLNDKLKIDVGVTYARQSIEANSSAELPEAMTMRASMAADANSFTNNYIGSEYTLSYSGLDIPINLKYKVLDKKNTNMYLITGLSSMVYLDQKGRETFSVDSKFTSNAVGDLQFASTVQEYTENYSPISGDSNVDLGKMLNLSFGYEYNLTNGTFLSIEPFYKLPLGSLTFTNQQFSIGGVNLRMNFQFKK
ncbi:PorT family protein [Echinicola marina]|uniref:outer membrane beta-barrel protein n=1 Tax=Echinicola marina TaxID=2859768 RepID=UPI001CF60682|nr:outer membrane beta-barrel protein [Echinicola marina]UCS94083.1 PorT family protein [Echinicola marina]